VLIFSRPVEPVAGQQRGSAFDDPGMDAKAVELDFMRPVGQPESSSPACTVRARSIVAAGQAPRSRPAQAQG
jgi:hypothetical protein